MFHIFTQVIKVWKTVNKFHPNLICLLINEKKKKKIGGK